MSDNVLFGIMPDGTPVYKVTLSSDHISCAILTYGGVLQSLLVPDSKGQAIDVVLGFDRLGDYFEQSAYIGALIGRYANRIGQSRFALNGRTYQLYANDGANHLHGGKVGFDKRVWTIAGQGRDWVTLSLTSPDGEEGYPGTLSVRVTYRLSGSELSLEYEAVSDQDTVCNLTNHAYFNLGGHDSGSIGQQMIRLYGDFYTPTDSELIPAGELLPVDGTPMDLRNEQPFGAHIDDDFIPLHQAGGYDHNWVVRGTPGVLRSAAQARCPASGIGMEVLTTLPGIQLYTGNGLSDLPAGKGGAHYDRRSAFCLESQYYPNSPNCPGYPQPVLKAGETWRHQTVLRFFCA